MVQLITTYRHDYTKPITNREKVLESHSRKPGECKETCDCCKQYTLTGTPLTLPEAQKTNLRMEWTGVAPMGRLIEPRIIPPDGDLNLGISKKTGESQCLEDQPNHFLKILKKCYPDLYGRLQKMPDNDLKRRLNVERLKTTYQIDYCRMREFPEGVYKGSNEADKEKNNIAIIHDGCEQFKKEVDVTLEGKKMDDSCQVGAHARKKTDLTPQPIEKTSHWGVSTEFTKKPQITEYMDRISRTGCVITRNKIHDHTDCKLESNCVHKLKIPCKIFK